MSILNRLDSSYILLSIINLFNNLNYFTYENINIIPRFLGRISAFEFNILPGKHSNMLLNKYNTLTFNHYCGIDFDIVKIFNLTRNNLNIYQGFFNINIFVFFIWLILPVTLFTESYLFYYNLEGRFRMTKKVISVSSKIFDDWKIFHLLFFVKEILLKNNFSLINNFYFYINFLNDIINYYHFDSVRKKTYASIIYKNINIKFINLSFNHKWLNSIIKKTVLNIFKTDPITRNSKLMNICSMRLKAISFSNYYNNIGLLK